MTKTQVEVITSVQRRRIWLRAGKERIVAAYPRPDALLKNSRATLHLTGHRSVIHFISCLLCKSPLATSRAAERTISSGGLR